MPKKLKKDEILVLLEKGFTLEEVPNFSNLSELGDLINDSDFDSKTKKGLFKILKKVTNESVNHSKLINELMVYVTRSKKNGF